MRSSISARLSKAVSLFFAATLCCGLIPTAAFAAPNSLSSIPEGEQGAASIVSGAEGGQSDVLALRSDDGASSVDGGGAASASENANDTEGLTGEGDDPSRVISTEASVSERNGEISVPAANERINETMMLQTRTIAQAESTRNFFLATTLESTRTVPIVNANLPLDTGSDDVVEPDAEGEGSSSENVESDDGKDGPEGEDPVGARLELAPYENNSVVSAESTVVGSFTYNGITYAVEPGGETAAVAAIDYNKLPEEFVEAQTIVLPSMVTSDGFDYYTVSRIADYAFASALPEESEEITTIAIPSSVTLIEDEAFSSFDTLQTISVPENSQLYPILCDMFKGSTIQVVVNDDAIAVYVDDEHASELMVDERSSYAADTTTATSGKTTVKLPSGYYFVGQYYDSLTHLKTLSASSRVNSITAYWGDTSDGSGCTFMQPGSYRLRTKVGAMAAEIKTLEIYSAARNSLAYGRWYFDAAFTRAVTLQNYGTADSSQNRNIPLTLYWKPNSHTVSWSSSKYGGEILLSDGTLTKSSSESVISDAGDGIGYVTFPTIRSQSVFKFKGWTKDSTGMSGYIAPIGGFQFEYDDKYTYASYPAGQTIAVSTDTTFYAVWARDMNWITTYPDGSTTTEVTEVVAKTEATPPAPAYSGEGWTFRGWVPEGTSQSGPYYTTANKPTVMLHNPYSFETVWGVKVNWKVDQSSGTVDSSTTFTSPNGASGIEYVQTDVLCGTKPLEAWPTISARKGYTFDGWTVASGNTEAEEDGVPKVKGPVTFTTSWTPKTSAVIFDASVSGNGSVTHESFATFDTALPSLPDDVSLDGIEGNGFAGYFDASGKQYYDANGDPCANSEGNVLLWDIDGDTTLYARLQAKTYEVSFDPSPGSGGQSAPVMATFGLAMPAISTTPPTRTGYSFQGWYDGADYATSTQYYTDKGESARTWNKAKDVTLYAGWKANEYAVSFDAGKDATGGQADPVTATFDSPLPDEISKTPPKRIGYSFCGWYDAEEGGICFYGKDGTPTGEVWKTASDATLHARWSLVGYDITLSPRAPENETEYEVMKDDAPFYSSTVIENVDYFTTLSKFDPQVPVIACDGYVFGGWVLEGTDRILFDENGHGQGTYGIEDDALCVPKWTPRTWKVKWDYAMPSTAEAEDPVTTTETFNATCKGVEDPTCDGYVFDGWKRGSSSIVSGTDIFRPQGGDLDASEIVYTATWRAIEYEVILIPGEHATYSDMDNKYVTSDDRYVYPYTVEEGGDGKWPLVAPDDDPGYVTVYWERQQSDGSWVRYDLTYVSPKDFRDTDGTLTFRAVQKAVTATITLTPGADKPGSALNDAPWRKHAYSLEESVTLPEKLTYPGHTFAGWRLVKEGDKEVENAPVLDPGTEIAAPANQNPLSRVYEAVWEADSYTVVFLRSEQNPYEVAQPVTDLAYDDEFTVPYATFRDAFTGGTPEGDILKDATSRILAHYEAYEGKGVYLQGQTLTVKEILEAYPSKKVADVNGKASYTIALYGFWTTSYDVDVPLKVAVSFDPERPYESMLFGEGHLRLTKDVDTPLVDVVGLVCEPVSATSDGPGTEAVFDSDPAVLASTYLTLASKGSESAPVEFNLGSVTNAGTSGLPFTGVVDGTGISQKRLADIGFTFGGATDAARTLDLSFGLRFDEGFDTKSLRYLNSSSVLNKNRQVPIARIYYTLALRSATVPAAIV